jgi:hypothetical protein
VVQGMMRLLMEAVMIIAIVSGLYFMTKMSASENNADNVRREGDEDNNDGDNP